jgi:hypothetical protein
MNAVLETSVFSQVVTGDPFPQGQDGFPIKDVGNDRDGVRFPIEGIFIPFVTRRTISTKGLPGSGLFLLGTDPSPLAQDS